MSSRGGEGAAEGVGFPHEGLVLPGRDEEAVGLADVAAKGLRDELDVADEAVAEGRVLADGLPLPGRERAGLLQDGVGEEF
jgi:hypothetical protein